MAFLIPDYGKIPQNDTPADGETCPFRRLIFEWLNYCRADDLSAKTIHGYREDVFKFYWWWKDYTHYSEKLGAHPSHITPKELREFAVYLREPLEHRWDVKVPERYRQLAPATVAHYARSIKVFFNWLEREGHIEKTPFNKSVRFTSRHKQDKVLKKLEQSDLTRLFAILTEAERLKSYLGCRNLAIVAFLLDSGVRLGELLSIRLVDLDLENNRCVVRGKTGQRYAVFSEACRTALLGYLKHPKYPGDNDALWLTSDCQTLSFSACQSLIRRLRIESGVNVHAHKLRHTFASIMAAQGVNVFDLKELLSGSSGRFI